MQKCNPILGGTLTQNNSRIVISDYIRKMAAAKVSTNLTRLAVAKNPHHLLGVFYSKSLRALAKMPSDYAYRKHTEQIILERAEMVKTIKVIIKILVLLEKWGHRIFSKYNG